MIPVNALAEGRVGRSMRVVEWSGPEAMAEHAPHCVDSEKHSTQQAAR